MRRTLRLLRPLDALLTPARSRLRRGTPLLGLLVGALAIGCANKATPIQTPASAAGQESGKGVDVFDRARQEAYQSSSITKLKQLGMVTMIYTQDHDNKLPPLEDMAAAWRALSPVMGGAGTGSKTARPVAELGQDWVTRKPFETNRAISRRDVTKLRRPAAVILYYQAKPGPNNERGVAFADGHVENVPELRWPEVQKTSQQSQ